MTGSRNQSGSAMSGRGHAQARSSARRAPGRPRPPDGRRGLAGDRGPCRLRAAAPRRRRSAQQSRRRQRAGAWRGPAGAPTAGAGARVDGPVEPPPRRHPPQPPSVPAERRSLTEPPAPGRRLLPTASVARVVATSESSGIGIGAPGADRVDERASSARWPLSCPVERALGRLALAPTRPSTRWKLSSRPLRRRR